MKFMEKLKKNEVTEVVFETSKYLNKTNAAKYLGLDRKEITQLVAMKEIVPVSLPTRVEPMYFLDQLNEFAKRMYCDAVKRAKL